MLFEKQENAIEKSVRFITSCTNDGEKIFVECIKCTRCKCWRSPSDFIDVEKGSRQLKTCNKCRERNAANMKANQCEHNKYKFSCWDCNPVYKQTASKKKLENKIDRFKNMIAKKTQKLESDRLDLETIKSTLLSLECDLILKKY